MVAQALKGQGYEAGINFELFEADYNQIERQIFDPSSTLYQFKPDFVIIFNATQKLVKKFYTLNNPEKSRFAEAQIEHAAQI